MLQALIRTLTELLDSKKAAYSFLATAFAAVLHLYFGVSPEHAILLVSPLGLATVAQAHVDAKQGSTSVATAHVPKKLPPSVPPSVSSSSDSAQG